MSEVNDQVVAQAPATEQPASHPQPVAEPQHQDGFLAKHRIETGAHEWRNGFLDCFHDAPNHLCLKGFFCPCFVYGRTQGRLRDPSLTGYERINTDCAMFVGASFCCGLSWIFPFFRRGDIRTLYDIRGNVLGDCLRSWCCMCCTLIQNEKEVIYRQSLQQSEKGYQAVPGMTATPQE